MTAKNRRKVLFEAFYLESRKRVWKALTDPTELARWLKQARFRAVPGHRFHWDEVDSECEISEIDPPRRLTFKLIRQSGTGALSIVTWKLETAGEGTRFIIEQEFLSQSDFKPRHQLVQLERNAA